MINSKVTNVSPGDISIRTILRPGDIGMVTWLHGHIYSREYQYGISFEAYVAHGLYEFYRQYDPVKDGVLICEHGDKMVGFLLLMHRGDTAQLRYFILLPDYRGIGLGRKLMDLFMKGLRERGYASAYLYTTHELTAAANLYKRCGFQLTEEKESANFGKLLKEQRYDLTTI